MRRRLLRASTITRWRGIAGAGLALIAAAVLTLVLFGPAASAMTFDGGNPAPTIASDQPDYPPGATVTLTGSNWRAGETVHVVVNDRVGQTWQHTADVVAASDGTITDQFTLPTWFVSIYDVTATGPTSGTATTSFTDATHVTVTSATASPATPATKAVYAIALTTSLALNTGSTSCNGTCQIFVTFPSGTGVASTIPASQVTVNGVTPTTVTSSGMMVTISLPSSQSILAGGTVNVAIGTGSTAANWPITNPSTPNNNYTVGVKTTTDTASGSSPSYVIDNLPTAAVVLSPKPATTNQLLTATATKSDADGQATKVTFVWKVNGTTKRTFTSASSTAATATDTFDLSTAGNGDKGDIVAVTATPNDGVADGTAASDNLTVANSAPAGSAQSGVTTPEDTAKTITLSAADADGDATTAFSIPTGGGPVHGILGAIGAPSCTGTVPKTCTATVTYTPSANYNGSDSFQFVATDGTSTGAPAAISLTITAVNDPPVAAPQSLTTPQRTALPVTLSATDVDGNALTFTAGSPTHGTLSALSAPSCTGVGTNSTCTVNTTYTPTGNYFGSDSFTFTASDGAGGTNTATVSLNVTLVNQAPVATPQSVSVAEDSISTVALTGTDPENDPLSFKITSLPAKGNLSVGAHAIVAADLPYSFTGANVDYVPNANFNGSDSFTFRANDGQLDSATAATVSITVTPVNDSPNANDTSVSVTEDGSASFNLATATNPDSTPLVKDLETANPNLTYTIVSSPSKGALTAGGTNGSFTYTPNPNANGTDTATYKVTDRGDPDNCGAPSAGCSAPLSSATYTITFTIAPVNDAPVATDGSATTDEDTPKAIDLSALASDVETLSGSLVYTIVTGPGHGTAVVGANGVVTYTPGGNYHGSDSFTYSVTDTGDPAGCAGGAPSCAAPKSSATKTISLTVNPVNDPPVGHDTSVDASTDGTASFDLSAIVNDVETANANLAYTIVSPPSKGTLTAGATPGSFSYKANGLTTGTDTATYRLTDRGDPDNCGAPGTGCAAAATSATYTITFALPTTTPPPVTSGLELWFNADTASATDGQPVSSWRDWSGNGRDLTAAPGANATMHRNFLNGHAAVEFDGINSLLKTYGSTFTISQPDTFFIVYRALDPSTASRAFVFDSTDSGIRQVFGRSGLYANRLYANQDLDAQGVSFPFPNFQIWAGTFNDGNASMYRNGDLVLTGNAGTSQIAGLTVGGLSTDGTNGYDRGHSQIADLLVYSGALTDTQRQSITDWLNQKYNVIGLPSGTVNTVAPSLAGRPVEGQTLTAMPGTWLGTPPITYSYEFRRCDSIGANCVAVGTGPTYTIPASGIGSAYRVAVTATNSAGSAVAVSPLTAVVTPAPNLNGDAPPVTAGLEMWFDASHETYADGAPVTRWSDLSGSGRDLTAGFPDQAPVFHANAVNGQPALEFDGVRSLVKTYGSTFTISQPDTYFILYKQLDQQEGYVFDSTNSSQRQLLGRGPTGELEMYANNPLTVSNPPFPFPAFQLWSGTFDGASSNVYKNGSLAAEGNAGNSPLPGLTVGALNSSSQYGYNYSHSLVSAILWYSGRLTDAQRQSIEGWLNQKYGVLSPIATLNAPATVDEGSPIAVSLDGAKGSSRETTGLTYAFDCGSGTGYGAFSTTSSISCPTTDNGTVTVRGTVQDATGKTKEYTATVAVPNVAPTGTLTAPQNPPLDRDFTLAVTNPVDPSSADTAAGFQYSFDCGSGTFGPSGSASSTTCHPSALGQLTVRATISDKDSGVTTLTKQINIVNAPTATLQAPTSVSEGGAIHLALANPTSGSGGTTFNYAFDCGSGYGLFALQNYVDCPTTDNGTIVVKALIRDDLGNTTEYTQTETITNVIPTVTAAASQSGSEGAAATFDLGSFTDPGPNDGLWTVAVNWGDALSSSFTTTTQGALSAGHTYADNGLYTVGVTVTDKDGGTSVLQSFTISVANVAPLVSIGAALNQLATEGTSQLVTLGSFSDPGPDASWSVDVNWGDGSAHNTFATSATGALSAVAHTWADNGTYTVVVKVTDKDGGSSSASFAVAVANVAPTAAINGAPASAPGGTAIPLTSSVSDPGTVDTFTYAWSVTKDSVAYGSTGSGSSYAFTPNTSGTYVVTLTVTDKDGGTGTDSKTIAVDSTPPTTTAACGGSACSAGFYSSAPVYVTLTATDVGSGVDRIVYTTDGSAPSVLHGTVYTGAISISTTTTVRFRAYDRVGNEEAIGQQLIQIDTTAPAVPTLTLGESSPVEYAIGTTLYYNPSGSNSGTFTVGATSSAASGIDRITFPAITGMTGGGDDTTGPYQSSYGWTATATAAGDQTVTARSGSGLTSSSTFRLAVDTTAPSGQSLALVGGPSFTTASVAFTSGDGSDGGAGLDTASRLVERASAPLSGGVCGSFGPYGGSYTSPDTTVASGNCYQYRFSIADNVGNRSTPTVTAIAKVDTTPPSAPALTFSALTHASLTGSTVYYNSNTSGGFTVGAASTDPESGVASYAFPSFGSGWGGTGGAYTFATGAADPAEPNNVTATNAPGLISAPTGFTVTADASAPVTTIACSGGCAGWHATVPTVTLTATDAGSGVAQILYSTDGSVPTTPYSGPFTVAATTSVRFAATDKVGNSESAQTQLVQVDTTAPSTPSLSISSLLNASVVGSTVYYRSGAAGGFTVTPSSSDSESGVAFYSYPNLGSGWSNTLGAYSFTAAAGDPVEPNNFTATNNALLVSNAATLIVTPDGAAPSTTIKCNGVACGTGFATASVNVTLSATDGLGSGVDHILYTTDGTDPSTVHGIYYLVGFNLTSTATVKFRAYDAVGNEEAIGQQLIRIDLTAPAAPTLTLGESSPFEYANGTTLYYNPSGSNTASFSVTAATIDAESGITKVSFPPIVGLSGGGDDTSNPYQSTYTWPAGATASGAQTVTAVNGASLTSSTPFTLVPDTTAPTGGSVGYPNGYAAGGSVTIATTDGSDGTGAGIDLASRTLERETATLANGTCGTYGAWTAVTSPDTVPDATCAQYRYRVSDLVGNQAISTSGNVVKVDSGIPSGPTLTLAESSPYEYASGTTLYYNPSVGNTGSFTVTAATGAASGIQKVTFPVLTGMSGGGDTTTSPYQSSYGWTAVSTASGSQTVTATSNAGGSSSAPFTVTRDTGAPTGQTATIGGPWFTTVSIAITTADGSDAISGLDTTSRLLERASAPLSGGVCGAFGPYGGSYTSPDTTVASGNCYQYRFSIADNVGNRSTVVTGVAKVDTTPPSAPALTFSALTHASVTGSTVYYNSNTSGGFTVGAASTDPESGVASYAFPSFGSGWGGSGGAYTFATGAADPAEPNNVTATNAAGLTSGPSAFGVTADGSGPGGGSIGYTDGYRTAASVAISLDDGTDALSGVNGSTEQLQRASATMTEGSCGTFGAYTTIATDPSLSYADATVASGNCYSYRYLVEDKVGNQTAYTTAAVAKVDTDPPTATLNDPGANLRQIVNLTSVTADTGGSGIASITYQRSDPTGWVTIPQAWDTTTAPDGLYNLRVVVVDRAGNQTISSVVTGRRVDNTPPTATLADPGANLRGTVTLSAATADSGGSGVASTTFQRSDPTLGWVTIPAAWNTTLTNDGLYDLRVVVLDVAGNQTISTVAARRVDNTAPNATMGALGSTITGTFALVSATSDAGSGVASVTYERQAVGSSTWTATPATFDTTTVPDGDYDFHVIAVDNAGNSTTSPALRTHVDNTSPRPTSVSPADGTSSVATSTKVTATFPRSMNSGTITASTFTLSSSSGSVAATVAYDSATLKATLTPTAALAENTTYTATLTTAVTATDGSSLYQAYTWTFSTGVMPPTVTANTPANGATGVSTGVAPTATFSRTMDAVTINGTTVTMSGPSGAVAATVTYDSGAKVVTIAPTASLAAGQSYTVQLSGGIKSQEGNALAPVSWSFTTQASSTPPTVTSQAPAPGATGLSVTTTASAVFSRDMKSSTLTASTFTLTGPSGAVAATVAYNGSTKTATLTPNAALASATTYTARLDGSIQALDGVPLGTAVSWTFTTTAAPEVLSTNPAAGTTGVSMSIVPTVQLSRALDTLTINTTNVKLLRSDGSAVSVSTTYNSATYTLTLNPATALDYSMTYTIQLGTGLHASDGTPLAAQFNSTFTTTGTGSTFRIDAGAASSYTASNGNVFSADASFTGGTARTVTNTITGTTDPALYQTERYGLWNYNIPVPLGTYDVRLHFVELTYSATGKRIFSVDVLNTSTVNDISNLDIYSKVGANKPYIVTIPNVLVSSGRLLRLKAVANVDQPEIAAIEIIPHPPTAGTLTPAANATGVSVTTPVSAVFSQMMNASSITGSTVTLTGPGGSAVAATVAYNAATLTATLTPTAPLAHGTTYTASLSGSIVDFFGMAMAPYSWTFTTG